MFCCTYIFSTIKRFVCFALCIEALALLFYSLHCIFLETKFVWDISKDAQKQTKKKQIKGAQSKCGESFRQHPNDRESEAKTFFFYCPKKYSHLIRHLK